MRSITIVGVALGNMRKKQDWTVTPSAEIAEGIVTMQCDKRIARVNIHKKEAILSHGKTNYFADLTPERGGKLVAVPQYVLDQIIEKTQSRKDFHGPVCVVGKTRIPYGWGSLDLPTEDTSDTLEGCRTLNGVELA